METLEIQEYKQNDLLKEKAVDPTLKATLKNRYPPSILAIEGKLNSNSVFTFCHNTLEEILMEIGIP